MNSHRTRWPWIITTMALILVGVVLVLGNQSFKTTEKTAFAEFNQRQLVLANEAAGGFEMYFRHLAEHMWALARKPKVQHLDEIPTRQEMQDTYYELEPWGVNDIAVVDASGMVRYNVMAPQIEGTDFSWRQYFLEAKRMTSSDTYIVEFIEFKGVEAGQKGVLLAVPMFEPAIAKTPGQFAGVVLCTLKLDTITQEFVAPIKSSVRGHAFLIDDEYNVLWAPDKSLYGRNLLKEGEGFPSFQQILEEMRSGVSGTAEFSYYRFEDSTDQYSGDNEEALIAFVPIHIGQESWAIGVWAPKEDARQLVRSVYYGQLLVVGLSILTIILGSSFALVMLYNTSKYLEKEVETKTGQLKESHERLLTVLDSLDATVYVADMETYEILFVNKRLRDLWGDVVGETCWQALHADQSGPCDFCVHERLFTANDEYGMVYGWEHQNADTGSWYETRDRAIQWVDGRIVHLQIAMDITERLQVEEALEKAYAFQQSVMDGVTEPIMVIGLDYRVKMMNRAAHELLSGDTDRSEPLLCYQISHQREMPCDGTEHPCPLEQVRESGQPVTVVHEHHQAKGEQRLVEIIASPLLEVDGTLQGIIESARDITERERARDELVKLRKAVESAGEAIFLTDRDGIIAYTNPEFTRLYGYGAEEVIGKTTPRILKSGMMTPRDYELFWETLLKKQVVKGEIINKRKDGSVVTVDGSANPILDENDDIAGFLAIQRDISERKQAEEALQRYAERLRALTAQLVEAGEAERQRVARELHDETSQSLATLIVTLGTVAQLSTDADIRQHLNQVKDLTVETLEGVKRLTLDLRPRLLDDFGLQAAVQWYSEERLSQAGITATVEVQDTEIRLPPYIETGLFRVVQEAVNNITHHSRAANAWIHVVWRSGELEIEIKDDGQGFYLQEVLNDPTSDRGLGLLGMQERVDIIGGTLAIESAPQTGTRISVRVPIT